MKKPKEQKANEFKVDPHEMFLNRRTAIKRIAAAVGGAVAATLIGQVPPTWGQSEGQVPAYDSFFSTYSSRYNGSYPSMSMHYFSSRPYNSKPHLSYGVPG